MKANREDSLVKFFHSIPSILIYQIITKSLLYVIVSLLKQAALLYLYHAGRSAITSGDLPYILRTKEGWVVMIIGLVSVFIYTVFDINAMFILSDNILHGKKKPWWIILKEAFISLKYFWHPQGLFVTLYMGLLGPLIGTAFGLSFMIGFSAPNFVLKYISANLWLRVLVFCGVMLYLFVVGIYIFTLLYVIFQHQKINVGMKSSRYIVTRNWKSFLKSMIGFLLAAILVEGAVTVGLYVLPMWAINTLSLSLYVSRVLKIFFIALFVVGSYLFILLFCPFFAMKITVLFEYYEKMQTTVIYPTRQNKKRNRVAGTLCILTLFVASTICANRFDVVFPVRNSAKIVAHRAGGNLTTENTLQGINEAIAHGADVAEIDVQRTVDGHYIVCHDSDLERLTGEKGDPKALTLEEIKEYRIINTARPWEDGDEIATLEEILDAAKGNIDLFIELKGKTADEQMVEDVYKMVKERDMLSQCVFTCFYYRIIEYIEETHPEIETGYLVYFSFGNLEEMSGDDLFVETECLSESEIDRIHNLGKKVGVWTVNTSSDLKLWLLSDVDYIVTDEIRGALALKRFLHLDDDEERIMDAMFLLM
ncbi:MAG: glycerophosphoryl diester phosphodiesterase membrane domain-containing protein [Lachnospiraceae bacterium]|nr:glycerophosphoryl diester phosphodiesterase membrane domain-containing protein [Lachnospiraceae bacterium]